MYSPIRKVVAFHIKYFWIFQLIMWSVEFETSSKLSKPYSADILTTWRDGCRTTATIQRQNSCCLVFCFRFSKNFAIPTNNFISVCEEKNTPKLYRYHPGLWLGKKWSCCKSTKRIAFGCQAATHWSETNNNPSKYKSVILIFSDFSVRDASINLFKPIQDILTNSHLIRKNSDALGLN